MKKKLSGKSVFAKMQKMAEEVRAATGAYCSIEVDGRAFSDSNSVTRFSLYMDITAHGEFFEFDDFLQIQDFVDHLR